MMRGELINVADGKNLTQEKGLRQGLLASLDESQMIVFEPKKAKHTVTVFTDVDCGCCAKLHREMPMYRRWHPSEISSFPSSWCGFQQWTQDSVRLV